MTKEEIESVARQAISESGLPVSAQVSTGDERTFDVWFSGKTTRELNVVIDTSLFDSWEAVLHEIKLKLRIHYSMIGSVQDATRRIPDTPQGPVDPSQ